MRRRLLLLLPAILAAPLPVRAAEPPRLGRVSRLEGAAELLRAGGSTALVLDGTLQPGDAIRTGPASKVSIDCPDGLVIVIGPDSEVSLDAYLQRPDGLQVAFGLLSGIMRLIGPTPSQPRRIDVQTRTAIASVRSTEWLVEVNAGGTSVLAIEGHVTVRGRAGGEVVLGPGQGTDVRPDQLPAVPRTWGPPRRAEAIRRTSF